MNEGRVPVRVTVGLAMWVIRPMLVLMMLVVNMGVRVFHLFIDVHALVTFGEV
jgi:hypothetical protein